MKYSSRQLPALVSTALTITALQAGNAKVESTAAVSPPAAAETKDVPFLSCTLSALNEQERLRHTELLGRLRAAVMEKRELPDGYAFRLGTGFGIVDLAEWITLERRCCPFFGFTIVAKPGDDVVWLHLTGGNEVKAFIQAVVLASESSIPVECGMCIQSPNSFSTTQLSCRSAPHCDPWEDCRSRRAVASRRTITISVEPSLTGQREAVAPTR